GDRDQRANARTGTLCALPRRGEAGDPAGQRARPRLRQPHPLRYHPCAARCPRSARPAPPRAVGARVDDMTAALTYVYCLVADRKRPSTAKRPKGLPGLGPLRLVQVGAEALWLVAADAPK